MNRQFSLQPDLDLAFPMSDTDDIEAIDRLLADRDSCLVRLAFLNAVRDVALAEPIDLPVPESIDHTTAIEAIREHKIAEALKLGLIDLDQIHDLLRDADALWKAHLATIERKSRIPVDDPIGVPADRRVSESSTYQSGTSTGFTELALEGRFDEFEKRLRDYMPSLLHVVGVQEELADEACRFLVDRIKSMHLTQGTHIYQVLPNAIAAFAEHNKIQLNRSITSLDWLVLLENVSVEIVLNAPIPSSAPDWISRCREELRYRATKHRDLIELDVEKPATVGDDSFRRIRRDLYAAARRIYSEMTA